MSDRERACSLCVSIRAGLCQGVLGFSGSPPAGHEFASNWTQSGQLVLFCSAGKINVLFLCFGAFSLDTYKTGLWRLKSSACRASQSKKERDILSSPCTSFSNTVCLSITSHSFTVALWRISSRVQHLSLIKPAPLGGYHCTSHSCSWLGREPQLAQTGSAVCWCDLCCCHGCFRLASLAQPTWSCASLYFVLWFYVPVPEKGHCRHSVQQSQWKALRPLMKTWWIVVTRSGQTG